MSNSGFGFDHDPGLKLSLAQEAIGFALADNEAAVPDVSGISVGLLQGAVTELQSLPADCSLTWSQGYWQQQPGDHVTGWLEKDFPDGSKLHVTLQEAVCPPKPVDPLWRDNALSVSLRTSHPTDQSKAVRVGYRVERNGKAVLCEVDKAFGANILGAMAMVDKLDEVDPLGEADLEEMIGGILLESSIMAQGLSPDLDADIVELREGSNAYKVVSDATRDEASGRQLEEQLGLQRERAISAEEVRTLVEFLKNL